MMGVPVIFSLKTGDCDCSQAQTGGWTPQEGPRRVTWAAPHSMPGFAPLSAPGPNSGCTAQASGAPPHGELESHGFKPRALQNFPFWKGESHSSSQEPPPEPVLSLTRLSLALIIYTSGPDATLHAFPKGKVLSVFQTSSLSREPGEKRHLKTEARLALEGCRQANRAGHD